MTQTIAEAPKMPANFPAVNDSFISREVAGGADQRLVNLRTEDFATLGRIKPDAQTQDAPADSSDNPDLPAHDFSNHDFSRHDLPNRGQEQVEEFVVPGAGVLVRGKELASMVSAEPTHVTANISGEQNLAHIVPQTGHRIGHEVSSQAPARPADQAPAATGTGDNARAQASGVVTSARLLERLGGTEMHVAFRSEALGSVNLRAVTRENAIEANIGVERAEVRAHLISELPSLEQTFTERNLRVENITISQGSTAAGTALSSGSDSHSRAFAQPQQPLPDRFRTDGAEHDLAFPESAMTPETPGLANGSTRLNLHV